MTDITRPYQEYTRICEIAGIPRRTDWIEHYNEIMNSSLPLKPEQPDKDKKPFLFRYRSSPLEEAEFMLVYGKDSYEARDLAKSKVYKPEALMLVTYGLEELNASKQEPDQSFALSFDEWYAQNGEETNIMFAESGMDRELDFDSERAFQDLYVAYVTNYSKVNSSNAK